MFGNDINDEYISKTDFDLIEAMANLPISSSVRYDISDIIKFHIHSKDVAIRHKGGDFMYSLKVNSQGKCETMVRELIKQKHVFYLKTSRPSSQISKCSVHSYTNYANAFMLKKPASFDNVVLYKNRREYQIKFDNEDWSIQFCHMYASPYIKNDCNDNFMYFLNEPKYCCRLVKNSVGIPDKEKLKELLNIFLPQVYKIK